MTLFKNIIGVLELYSKVIYFYLDFWATKEHWTVVFEKISQKYGPVFTFHFGLNPVVVIRDIDIARETFRKNDFTGRPDSLFGKYFYTKSENNFKIY